MRILSIVVTFNGKKWIDRCIGSQLESSIPLEIFVIDNGSDDGTLEIIREKYTEVEILETKRNLGFGKANNIGLKKAVEEDFDYAFLLNQDAWIEIDTVEVLIKNHQKWRNGVLCPIQLNGEGSTIDLMFNKYTIAKTRDLISDSIIGGYVKDVYPVPFANAACWLLPKEVLKNTGGFDPLFLHYGEDNDYINRVKDKGYQVGVCPHVKVYHDREERSDAKTDKKRVNKLYNDYLVALKSPELRTPTKRYYYKKMIVAALFSRMGINKNYYKCEFLALKQILNIYKEAIEHKKSEVKKYHHYLNN